jgi:hypothetical protein
MRPGISEGNGVTGVTALGPYTKASDRLSVSGAPKSFRRAQETERFGALCPTPPSPTPRQLSARIFIKITTYFVLTAAASYACRQLYPVCGTAGRWFEPTRLYHYRHTFPRSHDRTQFSTA